MTDERRLLEIEQAISELAMLIMIECNPAWSVAGHLDRIRREFQHIAPNESLTRRLPDVAHD